MEYFTLQIITTITFLIGESLLIFKKKSGWAWRQIGLALLVIINYLIGLYLLIIPTVASMVIGLLAYLKWRKDDKKKQVKGISLYLYNISSLFLY